MKWIYRLSSIVILGAALSLPFYADYRSGGSFLELDKVPDKIISALTPSEATINGQEANEAVNSAAGSAPSTASQTNNSITYYRWQDDQGQWHFSDQAPEGISEKASIDPNALQTISGMDQAVIDSAMGNNNEAEQMTEQKAAPDFTSSEPSLNNLTNVMENAQQAAQMMEQRNETLNQIVGE